MLTSSSPSTTSSPTASSNPNSLFTFTPPSAAATGAVLGAFVFVLAFFLAGSGTASSPSSAYPFSFSPSRSAREPLFLEAGVADAVPAVPAAVFLFGVLGCGVVLLLLLVLLVWRVEERAPYLFRLRRGSQFVRVFCFFLSMGRLRFEIRMDANGWGTQGIRARLTRPSVCSW